MKFNLVVDDGNTEIKDIFNGLNNRQSFPNVLAKSKEKRRIVKLEKTLLDSLHFHVRSQALTQLDDQYLVAGSLAYQQGEKAREVESGKNKTENEQSVVMILLDAATRAVELWKKELIVATYDPTYHPGKTILKVNFNLAVPIPMEELKSGKGEEFARILRGYVHRITFLQTKGAENVMVIMKFDHVEVFGEGLTAVFDLGTPDNNATQAIIPDLFEQQIIILGDLGGGTAERVVISDGEPHNVLTEGYNDFGTNKYIDRMKEEINKHTPLNISHRREIVKRIKEKEFDFTNVSQDKSGIMRKKNVNINEFVRAEIDELAEDVRVTLFEPAWDALQEVGFNILIGGGAAMVKNAFYKKYGSDVVFFLEDDGETIWLNAKGAYKMLCQELGIAWSDDDE